MVDECSSVGVNGWCKASGGSGPSYLVEVKLRKWQKSWDQAKDDVTLVESWETVKTYGILASELAQGSLMDSESCLE